MSFGPEDAKRIGSPLRIGQLVLPLLWGDDNFTFRADPFLRVMERNVMKAIADRKRRRFQAYNAPPQVSKSTFLEILTALWALAFWPNTRIILVAYSDDIAIKSGALVRDIIQNWGPQFFGMDIDPKYDSKQEWRLAGHMGGMLSVGIGSRITGQSGDLIVIGDVVKNMEEATSSTTLDKHWEEYQGSIRTRLQPGGTMLLGATRFSDQDISGRLAAQAKNPDFQGDRWETFSFKAIAEPTVDEQVEANDETWRDELGRRRGEPLTSRFSEPDKPEADPTTWDQHHFTAMQRTLSPFTFSCLYQQEPTSPTGGMFPPAKWGWYDMDNIPRMVSKRRVWDLAASEGAGDYTVGGLVGKDEEDRVYVLDIARFQKGPDEAMTEVKWRARTDGVATPIMIEEGRNGDGKTVVAFYQKALRNYTVTPANADGSKETRAKPHSVIQQQGRSLLPRRLIGTDPVTGAELWESPDWVPGFIDEHKKMMGDGRKGAHDDQIDVVAHAVNDMLDSEMVEIVVPGVAMHTTGGAGQIVVYDDDEDDEDDEGEFVFDRDMLDQLPGIMV